MSERFDKVDNSLQGKAESTDLHTALGLLDSLSKRLEISDD